MSRHKITNQPRFDFRDAAFEALEHFPQLRARTIFLLDQQNPDGSALKAYGEPNTVIAQMSNQSWRKNINGFLAYMREHKTSVACFIKGQPHQAIIFTPHSVLSPVHNDRAAMLFFEFDHELGHLLTSKGRNITEHGTTTEAENSAEAFATLRSIQRFGGARAHLDALSRWRARCLIASGNKTHITTAVIDAIIADSTRVDFSKLTPQETIMAANEYAQRYCPSGKDVDFAVANLHGAKDFASNGDHQQRLVSMLLTTSSPFIFHIGARAVVSVLANDIGAKLPKDLRNSMIMKLQSRAYKLGLEDTLAHLQASSGIIEPKTKKPASRAHGLVRSLR